MGFEFDLAFESLKKGQFGMKGSQYISNRPKAKAKRRIKFFSAERPTTGPTGGVGGGEGSNP